MTETDLLIASEMTWGQALSPEWITTSLILCFQCFHEKFLFDYNIQSLDTPNTYTRTKYFDLISLVIELACLREGEFFFLQELNLLKILNCIWLLDVVFVDRFYTFYEGMILLSPSQMNKFNRLRSNKHVFEQISTLCSVVSTTILLDI